MEKYRTTFLAAVAAVISAVFAFPHMTQAHCQIPCGIYDDHARVKAMMEDAATVEKAIRLIAQLSGKTDAGSVNQAVRWVMNKEKHAQNIISTISDYFLTQRIKPDQKDYAARLAGHHAVILAAMKAKQTTDPAAAQTLKSAIEALEAYYPPH